MRLTTARTVQLALLALSPLTHGLAFERSIDFSSPLLVPRDACSGNTADDRASWCDYSISTDYSTVVPDTGKTVEYWLELRNVTLAPDGVERIVLTVNGTLPGPTLYADWGDTVVIHVSNALAVNGTGIHWHGIRQQYTNSQDGVPSITQCPVAPGDSLTYTWRATQYGSSWYHSHFSLQAWEGVFGALIINGPATANYDVDAGPLFIQDWTHETVDQLYSYAQTVGPPTQDTGLINGTNVYGNGGSRFEMDVESGSTYRFHLINPSVDTFMDFSIDNHTLQIIATDFVPIEPYYTDIIGLGPGQRYDVIITANQSAVASDFWLRAVPDKFCSDNANSDDIKGIIHYGSSTGTPTTSPWTTDDSFLSCQDPPLASLVPYVSKDASATADVEAERDLSIQVANGTNVFKWFLNSITFLSEWDDPTSLQVVNGDTTFTSQQAVIELPQADEWMYLVIQQGNTGVHPIHLHGHDFFILAQAAGTFSDTNTTLNTKNPPRRDVAMLPAGGYLVLAWQADNPGVWLAHCHIGFHTSEGFALQFVERYDEIAPLYDAIELQSTCNNWDNYYHGSVYNQADSGV